MPISVYGHFGFALLMIPTAAADYLEYERFELIEALKPHINAGKIKVFSINSMNTESWMNREMEGAHKAIRHNQFNEYVVNEVVPFIRQLTSSQTPIITSGASFGAFHAMNLFMKKPEIFQGVIAMSGVYDLMEYTNGYYDEQVYFNSPSHFLPNLDDWETLDKIRKGKIVIATGSGNHEDPEANRRFSNLLNSKSIGHDLEIWGNDIHHDWPAWRKMLPYFLDVKF